jgi:hypothetical protein
LTAEITELTEASKDFLQFIWSQNGSKEARFGELRIINNGNVRQAYIPLERLDLVTSMVFGKGDDVYYGVLPRTRQSGSADAVIKQTRWIWADFDNKNISEGKAFFALMRCPVEPTVIIDSGHGYHAYWLLDRDEPFELVSDVMQNISKFFGADRVQDAPRVLRIPWTINYKEAPVPVRMIKWDMTSEGYPLEAFDRLLPVPEKPQVLPAIRKEGIIPATLPYWLVGMIEDGGPKGQRSEMCFKVVLWLIRYGYSYEDIEQVFRKFPNGIGQKFSERGNGPRWLMTTYRAANEASA